MTSDELKWHRVPELPDMLRSTDWSMVIRRVYDDGCTLYQVFDSSSMLDLDATLEARTSWQLVAWSPDSHEAREVAGIYWRTMQAEKATE